MEDERLVADLDELGHPLLLLLDVDERVARVAEDPEVAVDAHVDAGGLKERRVVRVDLDAALADQALDRHVGEDHAADSMSAAWSLRAISDRRARSPSGPSRPGRCSNRRAPRRTRGRSARTAAPTAPACGSD